MKQNVIAYGSRDPHQGQQRQTSVRKRMYEGTNKSSVSRRKMTPASLYTHYIDMNANSPTFGQRLEIPRT